MAVFKNLNEYYTDKNVRLITKDADEELGTIVNITKIQI